MVETVNICPLVRDIVAENYTDFEEHDIELEVEIPDEVISVNVDKKELSRAITNLVVNAYKHNRKGIKAKVSVEKTENKAVIKILDTGADIPQDMDIFEPFVTENTSRMSGRGTGLGLAITKRIIERNGGKIYISSSEEDYTKAFIVEL